MEKESTNNGYHDNRNKIRIKSKDNSAKNLHMSKWTAHYKTEIFDMVASLDEIYVNTL